MKFWLMTAGLILSLSMTACTSGQITTDQSLANSIITSAASASSAPALSVLDCGAAGNGVTDDTAAIQQAVNLAALSNLTVRFPAGTYQVNAVTGIRLTNGSRLLMDHSAVIRAAACSNASYQIVLVWNATNVTVSGGTIEGERLIHTGSTGEWGMGIDIRASANVTLSGLTVKECWGDGIYIGYNSSAIVLDGVTASHNRRNGLSVTYAQNVSVSDSSFIRTEGTEPQCGIDLEPNAGETVRDITISGCLFAGNAMDGLQASATKSGSLVTSVLISGNRFTENLRRGVWLCATSHTLITGNTALSNGGSAFCITSGSYSNIISSNTAGYTQAISGENGYGVLLYNCLENRVTHNTLFSNSGLGYRDDEPGGYTNTQSDNTMTGNGSL